VAVSKAWSSQRPAVHPTESLRLLAHAARLRGSGCGPAGEAADWSKLQPADFRRRAGRRSARRFPGHGEDQSCRAIVTMLGGAAARQPWADRLEDAVVGGTRRTKATGPIVEDWQDNPFVHGPLTAPVCADGRVFVARPDAHEVVALDAADGHVHWRFVANGRVDTPPTLRQGLCLFGCRSGWVYCLRATDGCLVWRLRAAPRDERIVAHGQLESPWPVPGSVLVVDGVAYFAAGGMPWPTAAFWSLRLSPPKAGFAGSSV